MRSSDGYRQLASDERFIDFDRTAVRSAELADVPVEISLHRVADAMHHEPCGLLSDAKRTGDLARRDSVLGVGKQPDGRKPLLQTERRVLKEIGRASCRARGEVSG